MKVVVIVVPGMSAALLGCYGNDWVDTPCVDSFACEGVLFDRHFADHPSIKGTWLSWTTGRYSFPWPDENTPASANALGGIRDLSDFGVHCTLICEHQMGNFLTMDRLGWIVHHVSHGGPVQGWVSAFSEARRKSASSRQWLIVVQLGLVSVASERNQLDTESENEATTTAYEALAASITEVDGLIAELREQTEISGDSSEIAWVLTGTHGECWLGAARLSEHLMHVPLIIRLPNAKSHGERFTGLTQSVDLLPTLHELLGLTPRSFHGVSLVPILEGKTASVRPFAAAGIRQPDAVEWALRTPNWGLNIAIPLGGTPPVAPRLYRKPEDRWEVNDVRQHHVEWADQLEKTLRGFVEATRRPGELQLPEVPRYDQLTES